ARVNADGSFAIRGLQASSVSFRLWSFSGALRIRRIERDGVEIKDAIEVRLGEQIASVRIVAYQAQGRIRGQVPVGGGGLREGRRLEVYAARTAPADGSKSGARMPVSTEGEGGGAFVDEKGRFVIEGLSAGEYELLITLNMRTADGGWQSVRPPGLN